MGRVISEVARRDAFDYLSAAGVSWNGRLEEVDFLSRLYDLAAIPSSDSRFPDARGDICQHRVNNPMDWDDDWVFSDPRFALMHGPDDVFLAFLCQTVHPIVRQSAQDAAELVDEYNQLLSSDGWILVETGQVAGRPVWTAQSLPAYPSTGELVLSHSQVPTSEYVAIQVTRMHAAVESDPELAIGTAKEFLETVCKTILHECDVHDFDSKTKLPQLVRRTLKELRLLPESVPEAAKGAQSVKVLLMNLATVTDKIAEVRNLYGSGHGKPGTTSGLQPRHARLAVGAAATLGCFLHETHAERSRDGST
jgi:hypothetical protein